MWKTVRFGAYEDMLKKSVYVSADGSTALAKVPASSLDSFKKTELDLRDKKVIDLDPASVSRVAIEGGAATARTVLERRPDAVVVGPVLLATTHSTSKPSTAPASKWTSNGNSADDAKVTALLDALHPLRADKYLAAASPSTQPASRYVLTITTKTMPAGQTLVLTDPGHDQPLIGTYNGLTFETARTVLTTVQQAMAHS